MSQVKIEFDAKCSTKRTLTQEEKNAILGGTKERPAILSMCSPVYEHEYSRYPEAIRLSFMDGHTAVYDLQIDQPHPVIVENIQIIRKWKQGYVNQPARRRRRK